MSIATGVPLWAIALAFAVLAPFAARALASWFEERVRARSRRVFSKGSAASSVDRRE
jgi:hypothetical protein